MSSAPTITTGSSPKAPGLTGIGTEPKFAIGQRALHVRHGGGGFLWDCISLVDDATVAAVQALAAGSPASPSPTRTTTPAWWSGAARSAMCRSTSTPTDADWVVRHDRAILFWDGDTREVGAGCHPDPLRRTLRGRHGAALGRRRRRRRRAPHRGHHHGRRGPPDGGIHVQLPQLHPAQCPRRRAVGAMVEPFEFEHVYGGWFGRNILAAGKQAVRYSVRRYLHAISDRGQP